MSDEIDIDVWANEPLPGVTPPVHVVPPVLPKVPFFGELLYNWRMLKRLNKNYTKYDFIYQRYSGESYAGAKFSKRRKIPFVLEFNSSEVWKLNNWSKTDNRLKNLFKKFIQLPVVKLIEKYNLNQASLIVVVSKALKETLVNDGIEASKILVNPNGVDIGRFANLPRNRSLGDDLGLCNKYVFGFIGTFGKWHGVMEMVRAANLFYEKHPKLKSRIKFLMIGHGKLFKYVNEFIIEHNLEELIILTGRVSQSENTHYLGLCDAFVSPHIPNPDGTKFFGSPTKIFEYMACRKPIIASNLDQIGEILNHNSTAVLTSPGDIDELANSFYTLFQDKQLQTLLAENSYSQALKFHSWNHHVQQILYSISNLSSIR